MIPKLSKDHFSVIYYHEVDGKTYADEADLVFRVFVERQRNLGLVDIEVSMFQFYYAYARFKDRPAELPSLVRLENKFIFTIFLGGSRYHYLRWLEKVQRKAAPLNGLALQITK